MWTTIVAGFVALFIVAEWLELFSMALRYKIMHRFFFVACVRVCCCRSSVCMRKGLGFAVSVLWKSAAKPQEFNKCAVPTRDSQCIRAYSFVGKRSNSSAVHFFFLILRSSNCSTVQIMCFYRGICMSWIVCTWHNKLTHIIVRHFPTTNYVTKLFPAINGGCVRVHHHIFRYVTAI